MTREPAADVLFPHKRPGHRAEDRRPLVVEPDEYCRLLLSHRSIDRVHRGLPRGFQGLRDPRTGETWIVREDALLQAS